jgi:serine/threonine protein kinase
MRKLKVFGVVLAIVVAAAAVLAKDQLNRNVILMQDGRVIPYDRVWESGADLFYENQREIHFVRQADIQTIGRQNLGLVLQAGTVKAAEYARGCWDGVRPLFRPGADGRLNWTPWLVLGSMAAPALLFFTLRFVRNRPQAPAAPRAPEPPRGPQQMPGRTDVVRFFLQLYRQQVGADPESAVEFGQLPGVSTGPNTVYELRVRHGADWVKRRMAIGPLGEEGGSRSTCFYVIFDRHLVVKIPPKPVTRLEDYLAGIRKEGHIVERLAPKECIVPKVSVILSEVHQLSPGVATPPDQVEEKYIAWLRKNPQHEVCLKIKGTFVYFMDLSRYYFLSHILEGLHDLGATIRAEIAATPELVRYPARFKERYGSANDAVGFDIRDLYHQAEAEAGRLLRSGSAPAAVTPHHVQRWFLRYLETRDIGDTGAELPAASKAALNAAFGRLFEKYAASVEAYLAAARAFARKLALEQNRTAVSGIVAHLLELLAWLSERKVAMRDLKPDNLLVAGDPQNYPGFLRSPADYSLGFIDVETAVYYGAAENDTVKQPLLGGTPYYATPSHLFPNTALARCFGDTARILHLQDWQSVLVMVYRTVTGRLLFDRTAKCFAEIKAHVIAAMQRGEPLDGYVEEASRAFWCDAVVEFQTKVKGAEKALRFIEVDIPPPAAAVFVRVLSEDARSLRETMRRLVESQSAFPNAASREQLLGAAPDRIDRIAAELRAKAGAGADANDTVQATLRFLHRLSTLKALAARKAQLVETLSAQPACRLSAFDILVFMFNSVLGAMAREEWMAPSAPKSDAPAAARDELSLATTV